MQSVSVAVAKDKLPYLLHLVENGEQIEITRHDKPVAVIAKHTDLLTHSNPTKFDIAYANFRRMIEQDDDWFSDEEIDEIFNPSREILVGLRHEEDFE